MKIELYSADWCAGCKLIKPTILSLEGIDLEVVDVEKDTDRALALGIKSIPVTRILNKDGSEKVRLVGNKTKQELESYLKQ